MEKTIILGYCKSSKNYFKYSYSAQDNDVIANIYIAKSIIWDNENPEKVPQTLTINIKKGE